MEYRAGLKRIICWIGQRSCRRMRALRDRIRDTWLHLVAFDTLW